MLAKNMTAGIGAGLIPNRAVASQPEGRNGTGGLKCGSEGKVKCAGARENRVRTLRRGVYPDRQFWVNSFSQKRLKFSPRDAAAAPWSERVRIVSRLLSATSPRA